jgi:hypothetical protein
MKIKFYGIKFLVVTNLRLKVFNLKLHAIKKFTTYVLSFILILKYTYKQGVLFYIFIFKNMAIWDEPIKKASLKIKYNYSCTHA